MANTIAAPGKTPLDIHMGTGNPTGAAFQASLMIDTYPSVFKPVHVCRTEIQAGLPLAILDTFFTVNYFEIAFFVLLKQVQEQLVFNIHSHLTDLHPPQIRRMSLKTDNSWRTFLNISFCFCFLLIPLTVIISLPAKEAKRGSSLNISRW